MPKRRAAARAGRSGRRITLTLDAAELARGHDGFLRGKPEPALVFAAWSVGTSSPRLLGRVLRHVVVRAAFPCTCAPAEPVLFRATSLPGHDRVAVLLAALEVDDGTDLARVYALLGEEDPVSIWSDASRSPEPRGIAETARAAEPDEAPKTVRLLHGRTNVEDSCRGDTWVGAALLVRPIGGGETEERMHVVSPDGRNDWTACLRLRT